MDNSSSSGPNTLNYLNVIAYVANVGVTYAIGAIGIGGASTNAELSEKYQTLVTPAGWAFSIWAIIFVSQLIFTVVQVLPQWRASALVQEGVGRYYVGVCVAQVLWTLCFSFEYIFFSVIAMLTIFGFLIGIVISQCKLEIVVSTREYWWLEFPFAIHAGWIAAASLVNINVLLVYLGQSSTVQLYAALASIVGVLILACLSLFAVSSPEFVPPCVLIWATAAIWAELGSPKDLIVGTFEEEAIRVVRTGACACCAVIAALVALVALRQRLLSRNDASSGEEGVYLRANNDGKAT